MSMNHDHSGCCGGSAKPAPKETQQPTQTVPDAKAQESITLSLPKPTAPQPKSKSCCG